MYSPYICKHTRDKRVGKVIDSMAQSSFERASMSQRQLSELRSSPSNDKRISNLVIHMLEGGFGSRIW